MPSKFVSLTSLLLFGNLISINGENAKCSTITSCGPNGKIPGSELYGGLQFFDKGLYVETECAGATCTAADEATCCLQEWSPGIPDDSFFTDRLGTYVSDFCITSQTAPAMQQVWGAEYCSNGPVKEIEFSSQDLDTWNEKIQYCAEQCKAHDGTGTKSVNGDACAAFMINTLNHNDNEYCNLFAHTKGDPMDGSKFAAYKFWDTYQWKGQYSKCYIKKTFVPEDTTDEADYASYCNYIPPAKCSTYDPNECENGLGLIGNAANVVCAGGTCIKLDDQNTCCKGDATCLVNQHVVFDPYQGENVCTNCTAGKTNDGSESTSNGPTDCSCILCDEDHKVVNNECVSCGDATKKAAPDGDASGANTVCYGKDDLTAAHVAKLINLVGGSAIDVATEQTCLKARYNAIAGCSSSTSAYSRL